jgi:hypothetical protein
LFRERNRIDAELARTVRVADVRQACEHDGLKTMPSWSAATRTCRRGGCSAGEVGRALQHLPALATAFAAGDVTADQVAAIAPIARDEHLAAAADQGVDLAEIDAALTSIACSQPHQVLGQAVHRYLAVLDADGPEPDPTEGRRLAIASTPRVGVPGRFDLDAVGWRSCRRRWSRWCRPAGAPATSAPAPSSWPMRWCSCATTRSPPVGCPSCAGTSRSDRADRPRATWSTRPPARARADSGSAR